MNVALCIVLVMCLKQCCCCCSVASPFIVIRVVLQCFYNTILHDVLLVCAANTSLLPFMYVCVAPECCLTLCCVVLHGRRRPGWGGGGAVPRGPPLPSARWGSGICTRRRCVWAAVRCSPPVPLLGERGGEGQC